MRRRRSHMRRGAVLLEVLIALVLITGGGMLILQVVGGAYDDLSRLRLREFAADLARSRLAELEAGLISIDELDGGTIDTIGSIDLAGEDLMVPPREVWLIEVETIQTPFEGLTEVIVHIYLEGLDGDSAGLETVEALATARQLVRLRERPQEEYEEDPLLRGLPQGGGR